MIQSGDPTGTGAHNCGFTIRDEFLPGLRFDNHFSMLGRAFPQRLVTQMYFPGDPLFSQDPIFNSIPDPRARERLIARFDLGLTQPDWALGFEWDIVLRGTGATALERAEDHR